MCTCTYVFVCVCVCVWVWVGVGVEEGEDGGGFHMQDWWKWRVTASRYRVSLDSDKNVLKLVVLILAQLCKFTNY